MENNYSKFCGAAVWLVSILFVIYAFCLNTTAAVFFDAIKNTLHATHFEVPLAMGAFILGFSLMQKDSYPANGVIKNE